MLAVCANAAYYPAMLEGCRGCIGVGVSALTGVSCISCLGTGGLGNLVGLIIAIFLSRVGRIVLTYKGMLAVCANAAYYPAMLEGYNLIRNINITAHAGVDGIPRLRAGRRDNLSGKFVRRKILSFVAVFTGRRVIGTVLVVAESISILVSVI